MQAGKGDGNRNACLSRWRIQRRVRRLRLRIPRTRPTGAFSDSTVGQSPPSAANVAMSADKSVIPKSWILPKTQADPIEALAVEALGRTLLPGRLIGSTHAPRRRGARGGPDGTTGPARRSPRGTNSGDRHLPLARARMSPSLRRSRPERHCAPLAGMIPRGAALAGRSTSPGRAGLVDRCRRRGTSGPSFTSGLRVDHLHRLS